MKYYGMLNSEANEIELENRKLAREIAREGFVLLKNNGVLPLNNNNTNKKIALYGVGARKTVKGGTGSGSVNERFSVSIETGFLNAGYEVTTKHLLDTFDELYTTTHKNWREMVEKKIEGRSIMESIGMVVATPFEYPDFPEFTEATDAETAIYILTRQAGEGNDRRAKEGDYFLTTDEKSTISQLSKAYKNLVVVINVGGYLDISEIIDDVDGLVFFSQGGEEGGNALVDVMTGEYSFSGKLTNTWAKNYYDYPNADKFGYINGDLDNENYTEGIYVGYRYFDSFKKETLFPFGFGLTYTNFNIETKSVEVVGTNVEINVEITNVGEVFSGKEIVQVYASCPQTELEKEYQRLVTFGKTSELAPKAKETLKLSFDLESLTSYKEDIASWVLEKGEYVIRVGNSSTNNFVKAVLKLSNNVVTETCDNCCTLQHELEKFETPKIHSKHDFEGEIIDLDCVIFNVKTNNYSIKNVVETAKEKEILNSLTTEEMAELLRGGDLRTSKKGHVTSGAGGKTTLNLLEKGIGNITLSDGPAGLNICNHLKRDEAGTEAALVIPERFNWGDTAKKNAEMVKQMQGVEVYRYATAWPVGILLAQTWNVSLAERFGDAIGKELETFGITLWLAPGMNINRNPLCGRMFEYYSEDPVISGEFAAHTTLGVQKHKGFGTTIKHFACNNQEDNRTGVSANLSERALREIYLKGFEIAVKKSQPLAIMSSYNKINGTYTPNNYDLLNKIARCEWGFEGLVMTDWSSCNEGLGKPELCPTSGNDLVMPGSEYDRVRILEAIENDSISSEVLRNSACRILRVIINGVSNVEYK